MNPASFMAGPLEAWPISLFLSLFLFAVVMLIVLDAGWYDR